MASSRNPRIRVANAVSRMILFLVGVFSPGMLDASGDEPHSSISAETDIHRPADSAERIQRAVVYLKDEGQRWIDKRGCVSCHQIPSMIWSLSAAKQRGFDVDAQWLDRWTRWSVEPVNFVKPELKADAATNEAMAANIDTMSALMLAIPQSSQQAWRATFAKSLLSQQNDDGSWKACGQLPAQKRPVRETTEATTLWTLVALKRSGYDDAAVNQKAVDFVRRDRDAESTEWHVVKYLLAHEYGNEDVVKLRKGLLNRQNEDGGWSWVRGDDSDALATGMAIYALAYTQNEPAPKTPQAKPVRAPQPIDRGVAFLLSSQRDDGSWSVPGTKKATRHRETATSNYWGTAWAVIGLLEASR